MTISIESLLEEKEGAHCQFKEAKRNFDSDEAVKCCCALSNCGGGMLVFGITDKRPRTVVGSQAFEQPERTREKIANKLKVPVDFEILHYGGKRILIFKVDCHPIGEPVQVDGIAWWYDGDSLGPMPETVRRKIYEEGTDFSARICSEASIKDLDAEAIESFRTKWINKSGINRIASLSKEQLLRDCEAITDDGITYAALVLFGTRASLGKYLPQSEIVFEYRSSEASGPANQREEFRVGFFNCYDRLWELINLRNDRQHYQEGFFLYDIPTFNERAVREAVLNAVSHRNYQAAGNVFIRQHPDRLTIESPGGLPNGVTLDNILDRQIPRNRRIAEIFALCGLVERSGQGMNIIYEESIKEAKQLPNFNGTDDNFVVITLNGLVLDPKMLAMINRIGNERLESLSTGDFLIIHALYHDEEIPSNLRARLKRLDNLGIVEHIGRSKYILSRTLYSVAGKAGVHTRKKGLDRETNKELIVKHIRTNGDKGTKFNELQQVLPNQSRSQLQDLMRELKEEKRIYCTGKTNAARWFIADK